MGTTTLYGNIDHLKYQAIPTNNDIQDMIRSDHLPWYGEANIHRPRSFQPHYDRLIYLYGGDPKEAGWCCGNTNDERSPEWDNNAAITRFSHGSLVEARSRW